VAGGQRSGGDWSLTSGARSTEGEVRAPEPRLSRHLVRVMMTDVLAYLIDWTQQQQQQQLYALIVVGH